MINKIHKKDDLDFWNLVTEDFVDFIDKEPQDHDTLVTVLYRIDDVITDNEKFWGYWIGYGTHHYDYGLELYDDTLYRVEEKEVTEKRWVRVE